MIKLEDMVKAASRDSYLSCGAAHRIAQAANVPKAAIGQLADYFGIEIRTARLAVLRSTKLFMKPNRK